MRTYAIQRWNWSQRAKKWVYVQLKNGKKVYKYQTTPPKEFKDLVLELRELNQSLVDEKDRKKQKEIFKKLIKLSQRMQAMRK